jgi:hypothetical protein
MKFARTCIALAALIAPSSFSKQATPQPTAYEITEATGEQTAVTGQILLEVRRFSQIGNCSLHNSQIGSIVPANAFPSRQFAR